MSAADLSCVHAPFSATAAARQRANHVPTAYRKSEQLMAA
jgi:hypothetical protein